MWLLIFCNTGCNVSFFLVVVICLMAALFVSGLVHRVCVTTWLVSLSSLFLFIKLNPSINIQILLTGLQAFLIILGMNKERPSATSVNLSCHRSIAKQEWHADNCLNVWFQNNTLIQRRKYFLYVIISALFYFTCLWYVA